jgi:hypothetical protein
MTQKNRPAANEQDSVAESRREKKTYQKPAFRYERVFETMALHCGKVAPTQNNCRNPGQRKAS